MAVITNKNTTGQPMSTAGKTGTQVVKFIPGPRVYIKASESTTATPVQSYFTKSAGQTPSGWTDLGTVNGVAKLTYTKEPKDVRTGIDNVLRARYSGQKTGKLEFALSQVDDVVLENLTGLTASIITAGSIINYRLGEDDMVQKALLLVLQNKLDGKEWQFYNPSAYMTLEFGEDGDAMVVNVSADLVAFTASGQTLECLMSTTVFA